eukprot:3190785-Alexandrium_andersonii.AAC.1
MQSVNGSRARECTNKHKRTSALAHVTANDEAPLRRPQAVRTPCPPREWPAFKGDALACAVGRERFWHAHVTVAWLRSLGALDGTGMRC